MRYKLLQKEDFNMMVFIILSFLLLSILSCKKIDNNFYNADYEEQFFKKPFPANERLNAIIDLFKNDNEQNNFVNALPSNIGLPIWDKTLNEKSTKSANYLARGIISDGKKNFIIPFTNNNKTISAILFAFYRENGYKYFCYTNDYLFYLCYSNQVSVNDKEKALTLFMFLSNYAFGNTEFKGIPKLAFKNSENRPDGEGTKFLSIKPLREILPDTLNITSDNYVIVCNTYRNVAECNCHAGEPCDWKEGCPTCTKEVCISEFTGFGGGGDPNPPFPPAPGYDPNVDPGGAGGGGNNEPPRIPPCPGAAWYDSAQPIGGGSGSIPCEPIQLINPTGKNFSDVFTGDEDNNSMDNFDLTNYLSYENGQTWPTIENVIPISDFVGWNTPGISVNCMSYAKAQIAKKGYKISNYGAFKQTVQVYRYPTGVDIEAAKSGVGYILDALQRGIPVIVGVDDKQGSSNPQTDNTTDHFVVIVGSGSDVIGNYFTFYDNASALTSQGTSPNNKFYYNALTGLISGSSQTDYAKSMPYPYIVTIIRKSK